MVRLVRLELTRLSTRASKTRMATNYITTAKNLQYLFKERRCIISVCIYYTVYLTLCQPHCK